MISYILFDLDNTLYPESSPLGPELARRINAYAANYLGVSLEEAERLRQTEMRPYGTTMRWLMVRHGMTDINDYIESIHPEDIASYISKDPRLPALLDSIAQPKSVLTNSSKNHATRVLRHLGIEERFEHLFDLSYSNFRGKPHRETYEQVLDSIARDPKEVLFVDDVPDYIRGFAEIGGKAVLIDEMDRRAGELKGIPSIRTLFELPPLIAEL